MNPTVSIIVPVYNAQKALHRCVDSILNQEYTDFELILANDGSKDSSGTICDEYAAKDSRVRVIHKENTGVSDTRNTAIAQAKGTYLQFLDSDDWITPDATKLFVRAATEHNCDLVIADFYRVVGEHVSHKGDIEEDSVLTREQFAAHMMENPADFYYGVIWNKFYRRDLIEKHQIRMDDSINWCEDFLFNLEYILHAEVFYALQVPVYYYVKTEGSLLSQNLNISNTIKMKLSVFEYYNNFYKNVYDKKDYDKNRIFVYRFLVDTAGDAMALPMLPGVKKLGSERNLVSTGAVSGDGVLMEAYRNRKLLERYLTTVATCNDLTLKEVVLLFYISQLPGECSCRELADISGMSRNSLILTLQKLVSKEFIKLSDLFKMPGKSLSIELLPACDSLLADFATAQNDYNAVRFADFSEEELAEYQRLSEKITENTQKILRT